MLYESIVCDLSSLDRALPRLHSSSSSLISPTLSTLPPKLKFKIAREPVVHGGQSVAGNGRFPEWAVESKRDTSLSRLSKVNKVWHTLCSPFLFETFAFIPTYLDDPDSCTSTSSCPTPASASTSIPVKNFTLTNDLIDYPEYLREQILPSYDRYIERLKVGADRLRQNSRGGRVSRAISLFSHVETISLRCHRAGDFPYLRFPNSITTLELNADEGYPSRAVFSAVAARIRTLFFETKATTSIALVPYALPDLTKLHLASTDQKHLRAFDNSPVVHLCLRTPGACFFTSGWERLLQALEAHKDMLKTLVILESWYCVDPVDLPKAERGFKAVRAACVANSVKATLPKVEQWPWM